MQVKENRKMMNKNMNLVISSVFMVMGLFAQESEQAHIFQTDSTWGSEFFTFPISFAPDVDYKGYEEAVFPRGWSKVESPEFWSYAFAWSIDMEEKVSAKELEADLKIYFDGLTQGVNKDKDFVVPPTQVKFKKKKSGKSGDSFEGILTIHDSFVTRKPLILNAKAEQLMCESGKSSVLVFRFSPQGFDQEMWKSLESFGLVEDACEL